MGFGNNSLTEKSAFGFRDWLLQHNEPATVRERIVFLNAVYEWGIKRQLVENNPWTEVSVKVPPKRRLKPFSIEEIKRILEGFALTGRQTRLKTRQYKECNDLW